MLQDVRALGVDLQPGQRFAQDVPVQKRALRTNGRAEIEQPRLHGKNLVKPLDVAARHLQHPEIDAALERIG